MDDDGYLWYQGRADDMFKAAGYRIGPTEIENCLVKHPGGRQCRRRAEAGCRARQRRQGVRRACRTRQAGPATADDKLIAELQAHVRGKLAPYEYPKEIEFIDELPMTTTGKIQRRVLRMLEQERTK